MIIKGIIKNKNELNYIDIIKKYINEKNIDTTKTYHNFENNLPHEIKIAFDKIKNGTIMNNLKKTLKNYEIINVIEMNEIYVASIGANGSDKVFETNHIDGIYALYPFCTLFRCLLGIVGNTSIKTIFSLDDKINTIKTNNYLLFDYNRTCHYIKKYTHINDNSQRIMLKIHYAAIPKFMNYKFINNNFLYLNHKYNSLQRANFLRSQNPKNILQKLNSYIINNITMLYGNFALYLGYFNLFVLLYIYYNYDKNMMYLISTLPYLIYINEYIFETIKLFEFKRDAKIYKLILWCIILYNYFKYPINYYSIMGLILGSLLTFTSFIALGDDRTYYGEKINKMKPLLINSFPYNLIYHPMVVGNLISFSSLLLNKNFSNDWSTIIYINIIGYIIYLLIEIFNISSNFSFINIKNEFDKYHQKNGNILIHILTSFLSLICIFAIGNKYIKINNFFVFVISYLTFKYSINNKNVIFPSTIFITLASIFSVFLQNISIIYLFLLLFILIGFQELSHHIYLEQTYLTSYIKNKNNKIEKFLLHTIWLVPLILSKYF